MRSVRIKPPFMTTSLHVLGTTFEFCSANGHSYQYLPCAHTLVVCSTLLVTRSLAKGKTRPFIHTVALQLPDKMIQHLADRISNTFDYVSGREGCFTAKANLQHQLKRVGVDLLHASEGPGWIG